jgi:hypothetical protein
MTVKCRYVLRRLREDVQTAVCSLKRPMVHFRFRVALNARAVVNQLPMVGQRDDRIHSGPAGLSPGDSKLRQASTFSALVHFIVEAL